MIHKEQALKKGIKIIDSKEAKNALFENLKTHFPQTIKDNQVDLHAIATLLGLPTQANIQGYELTFTGKALANALYSTPTQKLLKFEESFNVRSAESSKEDSNFIIKGDNLDVLKILKSAYSEKIKMIYIDPPYNTKNDNFIYPDNFRKDYKAILQEVGLLEIDDEGNEVESETLQFFKNIQGSRTHSGWLSFMLPRLKLARDLLREDGVIFISIDDNEQANLKILCDEIFGEENFIACIIWRKRAGGGNDSKHMAIEQDYILSYAKNIDSLVTNGIERTNLKQYKQDSKGYYLEKPLNDTSLQDSAGLHYDIQLPNGKILKGDEHQWKMAESTFLARLERDEIVFKPNDKVYYKHYVDIDSNLVPPSIFYNLTLNADATKEMKELFGDKIFDTPKPTKLIKHLLTFSVIPNLNNEADIVLDFFAGSGTTAHAVMELNAEDNGNRKFILVQIDEPINESKNKVAYDFCKNELKSKNPAISDITIERVKRASAKIASQNKDFNASFAVLSLSDKPELITTKKGTLKLLSNANISPFDKALNLALQSGKTLDKPLKTIFENRLYQCEDCLYLIACDKEVLEFLRNSQNEYIFIDGFEDINLEDFLNLDSSLNDRLRVVY